MVAVVLRAWPRLSETFIAQELLELERRGLNMRIYALKKMGANEAHPLHLQLKSPVVYLGTSLWRNPWQFLRAWLLSCRNRGYAKARRILQQQLASERREGYHSTRRRKNFRRGFLLSSRLPRNTALIYAHFLHDPASVARYAAVMRGFEWSFSAHAKDIWTLPKEEVQQKVQSACWGVTCTDFHRRYLAQLGGDWGKITCIYHGLDLRRFPDYADRSLGPAGEDPENPVVILTAARAAPKKGLDTLLSALSLLPKELNWRWRLVGGDEEGKRDLALEAGSLHLHDRIDWVAPLKHHELLDEYRNVDVFALPCRIAADGDRDGIPNVLMEAMSQRLPVLSTWLPSIRELVTDGGVLVSPNDISSLAEEIETLIRNPWQRLKMGESGRRLIEKRFSFDHHIEALAGKFGLPSLLGAAGENSEKSAAGIGLGFATAPGVQALRTPNIGTL